MNPSRLLVDLVVGKYAHPGIQNVAIYGAGINGLLLKKHLRHSDMTLRFFCDSSPAKQGTLIEGVLCVSLEELSVHKDEVIVFISPNRSEAIHQELASRGFSYIVPFHVFHLFRLLPAANSPESLTKVPIFGHFYSLYPDIDDILAKAERVFDNDKEVLDIDFQEQKQLAILEQMKQLYASIPAWEDISSTRSTPYRHRWRNPNLSAADAIGLHCMLRILNPRRLIEVGSGYTSAVTLDTNEYYLDGKVQLTFIEPYPVTLRSILKETDRVELIERKLQDVPLEQFEHLESGDVLFIDSTHVSKINSDVNYLFFEIFPRLKQGVIIHLHDIFYPFEYPKKWIFDGMIWNELYLLRAFLQNNSNFSILFFQNMLEKKHMNRFLKEWPLNDPVHGGSIWLEKK